MIKLIGLDLDGTVLNNAKQVTAATKQAVEAAVSKGVYVVPVTGRPYMGLQNAEELLQIHGVRYAITSNGASIYDLETGQCIRKNWMPVEKVVEVLQTLAPFPLVPDCFIGGRGHMSDSNREKIRNLPMGSIMQDYILNTRMFVEDLLSFVQENRKEAEKITINFFAGEDGKTLLHGSRVRMLLEKIEGITVVSGAPHNLEVNRMGVSKSSGLKALGDILGISMDSMMVCGDSENDIEMIRDAGVGVAMANSGEAVKAAAGFVTKSNEEDGVAYAIQSFVLSDSSTDVN